MTADPQLERRLREAFQSDSSATAAIDIHAAAMARAARSRQRPGWLAGGATPRVQAVPSPRLAFLVAVALLLLALGAVLVGGAMRFIEKEPEIGTIFYATSDNTSSPFYNLRSVRSDGSEPKLLREGICPMLSTDGAVFAYISGRGGADGNLVAAAGDGSSPRTLEDISTTTVPAMSPDGSRVAWLRPLRPITESGTTGLTTVGLENELWVTPLSGGPGLAIVPEQAARNTWFGEPTWSPDGTRIAMAEMTTVIEGDTMHAFRSGIWVVNTNGTGLHLVSDRIGIGEPGLSWSPDGRWLAFAGLADDYAIPSPPPALFPEDAYGSIELFVVGVDGVDEHAMTDTPTDIEADPRWSPDGAHLAYELGRWIATIPMNGGAPAGPPVLGRSEGAAGSLRLGSWSPDGRQLVAIEFRPPPVEGLRPPAALVLFDPELTPPGETILANARNVVDWCGMPWRAP